MTALIDNFGQDGRALAEELGVPAVAVPLQRGSPRHRAAPAAGRPGVGRVRHRAAAAGSPQLADRGAFRLLVSGLYPLSDVSDAYADLRKLHSRGKVVLATHPVTTVRTLRAREVWEASA